MLVIGIKTKPNGVMKVKAVPSSACLGRRFARSHASVSAVAGSARPHSRGVSRSLRAEAHPERKCWDPKDGELCLVRTKSGETLMEVRSDSDVQIDRRNWV